MYPSLTINSNGILHNLNAMRSLCEQNGIYLNVATKGIVGFEPVFRLLIENGVTSISESRIQNLKKFSGYEVEKWLIRLPLPSEAAETVRFADVSLNSERTVIEALSAEATKLGRIHKVVIMLELGELREGCMPEELLPLCERCLELPGVELLGVGTNLSCINEIVPSKDNMTRLVEAAQMVEESLAIKLTFISGGGSSTILMLENGELPSQINHLRLGESILVGNITCHNIPFNGAEIDNFILDAEIIEIKEKPSLPYGNSPNRDPSHAADALTEDRGLRKRAIIAAGKQDVHIKDLTPLDQDMELLGDSSDCFIADITSCRTEYQVGDIIKLRLNYNGLVSVMVASHIPKVII